MAGRSKCGLADIEKSPTQKYRRCEDNRSSEWGPMNAIEMRSLRLAACLALVAVQVATGSPTASADGGKIPGPGCEITSPCWQSYEQGHQQTMNDYMSSPREFGNLIGSFSNPQQAVALCAKELAAAINSGNPPPDVRGFRMGCGDVELAAWQNEGQIDIPTRLQNSFH